MILTPAEHKSNHNLLSQRGRTQVLPRRAGKQASGGAGLGLAICRRIAELHGARLEIRSEPGRGTDVEFTLPLHPGEDAETADPVSCD